MVFEIIMMLAMLPVPDFPMPLVIPKGAIGIYDYMSMQYACTTPESCLHEIGHLVDHEADMISMGFGFIDTVIRYREEHEADGYFGELIYNFPGIEGNPYTLYINGHYWGGYTELYATILQMSLEEEMPEEFKEFYDWDRVEELYGD